MNTDQTFQLSSLIPSLQLKVIANLWSNAESCVCVQLAHTDCSGPLPAYFDELTALTTLNLDLSGLSNGPTKNSRGEYLPEFLQFDR